MAQRDLHDNIQVLRCISPVALGTTGTGKTGKPFDTRGYRGVELVLDYGPVTATNATVTPTVLEGDVTGTMTSVADADLLGLEANAALGQAATRTSGTSKNITKRIGYIGTKRYVNVKLINTISAGIIAGAHAILSGPSHRPTTT